MRDFSADLVTWRRKRAELVLRMRKLSGEKLDRLCEDIKTIEKHIRRLEETMLR